MTEKQKYCDGRCYDANGDKLDVRKRPKCRCLCGGVNHGVGLEKARASGLVKSGVQKANTDSVIRNTGVV